jgi:hypothetical protein
LASPEVIAEEALREDGEEHQTAGQDRLHGRERGERERLDVQAPREQRKDPANGEPPLPKQICRAAQRMTHLDGSGEHCTASLEQGTQIGTQRTHQCKAQSQEHRERRSLTIRRSVFDRLPACERDAGS